MKEWGLVHKMKNNFASCNLHTYGTSNQKVFAINFKKIHFITYLSSVIDLDFDAFGKE